MVYKNTKLKSNPNAFGSICKLYFIDWKETLSSGIQFSKFVSPDGTIPDHGVTDTEFLEIIPALYGCMYKDSIEETDAGKMCNSEITLKLHGLDSAMINALQGWMYKRCVVIFVQPGGLQRIMGSEDVGCDLTWEEDVNPSPTDYNNSTIRIRWQSAEKPKVYSGSIFI